MLVLNLCLLTQQIMILMQSNVRNSWFWCECKVSPYTVAEHTACNKGFCMLFDAVCCCQNTPLASRKVVVGVVVPLPVQAVQVQSFSTSKADGEITWHC